MIFCRCGLKTFHMRGKQAFLEAFPGDYELSAVFMATPGMVFTGSHSFQLAIQGNWEADFDRLMEVLETFEACAMDNGKETEGGEAGSLAGEPAAASAPGGDEAE